MKALAAAVAGGALPNLKHLSLGSNRIGDKGMKALAAATASRPSGASAAHPRRRARRTGDGVIRPHRCHAPGRSAAATRAETKAVAIS